MLSQASLINVLIFTITSFLRFHQVRTKKKQEKLNRLRKYCAAIIMGIVLIKSTMPLYKARAATIRPTTPPERVSISLFRLSATAAPVASAAALPDADEAADAAASDADEETRLAVDPDSDEPVEAAELPESVVLSALPVAGVEAAVPEVLAVITPVGVLPLT